MRHYTRRRQVQVALLTLLTAIGLFVGFYLGQRAAYGGMGIDPELYREMGALVPAAEEEIARLEHDLEVGRTRNEVDRTAVEMVRREIAAQKKQILNLEEGLRFYQGLMAPEDIAKGLMLRPIELVATGVKNHFSFRLVAQQEARKHSLLKGWLAVEVVGILDGEEQRFPIAALSEDIEADRIPLRFRYFQAIEGELVLPAGFLPREISMIAQASAPTRVEVSEKFPWSVTEGFTYVGK